jgi:FkbM family methyltransferase
MSLLQTFLLKINHSLYQVGFIDSYIGSRVYLISYYFYKKLYEAKRFLKILLFLKRNFGEQSISTFVDVGAHVGTTTRMILGVFPLSKGFAFEPDPRNVRFFTDWNRKFLDCQQITIESIAVWRNSGLIPFKFQESNTANNKFDDSSNSMCDCISLDDYFLDFQGTIDLVKIDVQGFEREVLQGSQYLLDKNLPFLIIEFDLSALHNSRNKTKALATLLLDKGYVPWDILGNHEMPIDTLLSRVHKEICYDALFFNTRKM